MVDRDRYGRVELGSLIGYTKNILPFYRQVFETARTKE